MNHEGTGGTSESQLVVYATVDSDCNDELIDNAFVSAEENTTCTEDSYSYATTKGTCKTSNCTVDYPGKCHKIQGGARRQRASF